MACPVFLAPLADVASYCFTVFRTNRWKLVNKRAEQDKRYKSRFNEKFTIDMNMIRLAIKIANYNGRCTVYSALEAPVACIVAPVKKKLHYIQWSVNRNCLKSTSCPKAFLWPLTAFLRSYRLCLKGWKVQSKSIRKLFFSFHFFFLFCWSPARSVLIFALLWYVHTLLSLLLLVWEFLR